MRTYQKRFPAVLLIMVTIGATACGRSEAKNEPEATVQDTMLLHDLAQANRNTAPLDADTMPVLVSNRARPSSPAMIDVTGGVKPKRSTDTTQRPPANPGLRPPTRANDAPEPTNVPVRGPGSPIGDPCDSPAPEDQRTCLNRSIARADVDLNSVYQQLISQARISGGEALEERFRQSEREWIDRRDSECRRRTRSQEGTLWARIRAACLAEYSARRTAELQESLNGLRGR